MPITVDDPTVGGAWLSLKFYVTPCPSNGCDVTALRGGVAAAQDDLHATARDN
jgi:hypothetical protein